MVEWPGTVVTQLSVLAQSKSEATLKHDVGHI